MVRILLIALLAAVWAGLAVAAEPLSVELTKEKLLRFGMEQAKADEAVSNEDDWEVAYRIVTPSTMDIACRYKKDLYFEARFYLGKCYYIEKRIEVAAEELEPIFTYWHDKLGDTPEATQSHDGRLLFSRWSSDDREVALTAYRRAPDKFLMTFEEFDPEIVGVAQHVQESELDQMLTEEDPLTGKSRPAKGEDDPDKL